MNSNYIDKNKIKYNYLPIPAIGDVFTTKYYIESMETEDVQKVTYCKDCILRYTSGCFSKHETADMDFCSCGKDKNNE